MMKTKVTRNELAGYSRSEFKTRLKRLGFKVPRTFFRDSCIAEYKNRRYRFRHWGDCYTNDPSFVVDVAELNRDFDRWANSTAETISIKDFLKQFGVNDE